MRSEFQLQMHLIYRETLSRLEVLHKRAAEHQDVMPTSEFCRWLLFSGILKLLEQNPAGEPCKVDGAFLRWKTEEVLRECNEYFSRLNKQPRITEVGSLHEKVDLIAGYLSRLVPATPPRGGSADSPQFTVISGGLADSPSLEEQRATIRQENAS